MKVHPLHVGDTKVPYGQFYGGLEGWSGLAGFGRFATDKSRYILVPIHAYLIEHPYAGALLVDTGISWAQAHRHDQYYAGSLHYVLDTDEYWLAPEQELTAQLARFGYRPEDVSTVILTHLHEDHVGGLRDLGHARVVLSRAEWDGHSARAFGIVPIIYQPSLTGVRDWEFVDYTSGPFHSFAACRTCLEMAACCLLPTPGHGPGHQCVLVRMDGYELLITGDILYTLRHLAVDQVRALQFGGTLEKQQLDSIRRVQALPRELPELVLVPGHDHSAYQFEHLVPFLADGVLAAEERQAIKAYETAIFDAHDNLLANAQPHFVAPSDGGTLGTVTG